MSDKNIKVIAIVMLIAGLMVGFGVGAAVSFFWTTGEMSTWFYDNSEELCANITQAKFYNGLADAAHSNSTIKFVNDTGILVQ